MTGNMKPKFAKVCCFQKLVNLLYIYIYIYIYIYNPFSIDKMSYLCSDIPSMIYYFAFRAKILRKATTKCSSNDFRSSSKALLNKSPEPGWKYCRFKKDAF